MSVIATSSGAASAYVKEGYSNIRIGMFLEIATTLGALFGAFLATMTPTSTIAIVFGIILIYSSIVSVRPPHPTPAAAHPDKLAGLLRVDSSYPTGEGIRNYYVHSIPGGFVMMFGAGTISGLLGIGSGVMKVLAMDRAMRIPFKVSTTTSNFMIGVTAAASAGVYLLRGYLDPGIAAPVVLGVLPGALLGARLLPHLRTRALRSVFAVVITALAVEMLYQGVTGRL